LVGKDPLHHRVEDNDRTVPGLGDRGNEGMTGRREGDKELREEDGIPMRRPRKGRGRGRC